MKEPQLSPATVVDDSRLRAMAPAIEEQFSKSKPAMGEIVKLWGMLRLFQEEAERIYCHVVNKIEGRGRGRPTHPWDLKVLFEKYLPNVEERSAYRLFTCGEFIAQTFEIQFLPATLQKKVELPKLAAATPRELEKIDRRLPKKQKDLFEFAEGGSAKSWLDQFAQTRRGGNQYDRSGDKGKRQPFSLEKFRRSYRDRAMAAGEACRDMLAGETFYALTPRELTVVSGVVEKLRAELLAFSRKTEEEREIIFQETAVKFLKKYGAK